MSATKLALKAAKAAIDAHSYEAALEHIDKALLTDPNNYHAYV